MTANKAPTEIEPKTRVRFGLRVKLLTAFTIAFTVVFAVLSIFILTYVTNAAQNKIQQDLRQTAAGSALTVNVPDLQSLLTQVPDYDPKNPYPRDNNLYGKFNSELNHIRELVPEARPYIYVLDPRDDTLRWVATWDAVDQQSTTSVPYRGLVSDVVDADRVAHMKEGLQQTVDQSAYTDANGSWIATYSPITGPDGTVVGAIGIDYPLAYLEEVRAGAIRVVAPILVVGYVLLLVLVLVVSTWLTRPLKRLTKATTRIAEGEYDLDLSGVMSTRFPDEMAVLAESFATMADKVRIREKELTRQVTQLRVEIDAAKRDQAVTEITESDFFTSLAAKAQAMRSRNAEPPADPGIQSTT